MNIDLSGKTALVTGSTAGIGRAIAEGLGRAGAAIVINGRTEARVSTAITEIKALLPDADVNGVAADVTTGEGADALAAGAKNIDILVNNVGLTRLKPFLELTDDDWLELFNINVLSGVRMARHHLPAMMKRGWGRVVFISSESALAISKDMIDYAMTKTAELAISRGLAELAGATGVTVNAIIPGPTNSEFLSSWVQEQAEAEGVTPDEAGNNLVRTMRPTSLLQRLMTTEEIANMVVYICSKQASATTGAALRVDGGILRQIP